jgi:hypothetical protein
LQTLSSDRTTVKEKRMALLLFERLRNVGSGKVLTLADDGFLKQFPFDAANLNQQWLRLDPGTARIVVRTSNRVIDAIGGNLVNNTRLQVYARTGNANQRWTLQDTGDRDGALFVFADNTQEVWDVENASLE